MVCNPKAFAIQAHLVNLLQLLIGFFKTTPTINFLFSANRSIFYNQPTESSEIGNKPRNEEPLVEETFHAEKGTHFAAGSQTKSSCKLIPGTEKHYLLPLAF